MAESNDSTSLPLIGRKRVKVVSRWLTQIGFRTVIKERQFGRWIVRDPRDPGVALCGVDNALTRSELDRPGFDLAVEAWPRRVVPAVSAISRCTAVVARA